MSSRSSNYLAFQYASGLGANVINVSFGNTVSTIGTCSNFTTEQEKYSARISDLAQEGADVTFANTIIVAAGDNCDQNYDSPFIFDWPVELDAPNIIAVTAKGHGADVRPGFSRAFGKETFENVGRSMHRSRVPFRRQVRMISTISRSVSHRFGAQRNAWQCVMNLNHATPITHVQRSNFLAACLLAIHFHNHVWGSHRRDVATALCNAKRKELTSNVSILVGGRVEYAPMGSHAPMTRVS